MMPPVIILAGGLGKRLRRVTRDNMPKPMVPITYHNKEYPFMEFLLACLYVQGIHKIIMCVDHQADQIVSYFGDGQRYGMQISYDNAGPAQTAARVKHAMEKIDYPEVIIHCGDVFHPLDIDRFLNNFQQHPKNLMQISVHSPAQGEGADANLVIDEKGQVLGYKTPELGYKKEISNMSRLVLDSGVLVVRRKVLTYISDSSAASLTEDLYPALIAQQVVGTYGSKAAFFDIGTPPQYLRFCQYVAETGVQPLSQQANSPGLGM